MEPHREKSTGTGRESVEKAACAAGAACAARVIRAAKTAGRGPGVSVEKAACTAAALPGYGLHMDRIQTAAAGLDCVGNLDAWRQMGAACVGNV